MNSDVSGIATPPSLLVLPNFIQTKDQVLALIKELLALEDFLYRARVRQSGTKMSLPPTTKELDKFATANKRNILNHIHRLELAKFLRKVAQQAPVVVVYSAGHDNRLIEAVVTWFRSHIHAQTLFQLSVYSKVGGGCMVRIKHKTYDFSLRSRFDKAVPDLHQALQFTSAPAPASTVERGKYF